MSEFTVKVTLDSITPTKASVTLAPSFGAAMVVSGMGANQEDTNEALVAGAHMRANDMFKAYLRATHGSDWEDRFRDNSADLIRILGGVKAQVRQLLGSADTPDPTETPAKYKKCPFCSSPKHSIQSDDIGSWVQCDNCGGAADISVWNMRGGKK